MFCPNCGKNVEEGASFCGECGTPIAPAAPVAPVGQETLIVPELPVTELPDGAAMDQATIVVPGLTDVPPAAPVEEKKKNKTGLLIGLIAGAAVLLIGLTVLICYIIFSGGNNTDSVKKNTTTTATTTVDQPADPDPVTDADALRSQLKSYTLNGLTYYLSDVFVESAREPQLVAYETPELSSALTARVYSGALEEFGPEAAQIQDSKGFVQWLSLQDTDGACEVTMGERYGVSYVVRKNEVGEMTVMGCYARDGYYWMIEVYSFPSSETTIDLATLAQIDENFVAPQPEQPAEQDVSVSGLHLTLDSSFTTEEAGSFANDQMSLYLRYCPLSELVEVTTSEDFARQYLDQRDPEQFQRMELGNVGDFYYVLMTDDNGWTTLIGMYTYEGHGWQIIGDTHDFDNQGQALLGFMTSGRLVQEELPVLEVQPQNVEFAGLTVTLPGSYKEIYRDNEYVFMSGEMEVYIFTGTMSALEQSYGSAKEMAQAEQAMYKGFWDFVDYYELGGVSCLLLWDATEDESTKTAYGYYVSGEIWWLIEVKNTAGLDNNAMLSIASSGVYQEAEQPEENQELVIRQRPDMSCDTFADYYGLKIFYDPSWSVDTTWGPTGDYEGDGITMYSYGYTLAEKGVADAVELAWEVAEEYGPQWQNCEVGLADGVPYVFLTDEAAGYAMVIGTYSDGENCWEIDIHCYDANKLDQALWFATAAVVESTTNET